MVEVDFYAVDADCNDAHFDGDEKACPIRVPVFQKLSSNSCASHTVWALLWPFVLPPGSSLKNRVDWQCLVG
eukprot:12048552-Karenia_brevis.AAC.1